MSPKDCREFAWLFGDINPIHLSAMTARLFGQRGVVAHGLLAANFALDILLQKAGNCLSDIGKCGTTN